MSTTMTNTARRNAALAAMQRANDAIETAVVTLSEAQEMAQAFRGKITNRAAFALTMSDVALSEMTPTVAKRVTALAETRKTRKATMHHITRDVIAVETVNGKALWVYKLTNGKRDAGVRVLSMAAAEALAATL